MEIDKLINIVKAHPESMISRGSIIDLIANNRDIWILTLKSLLIKNTTLYISSHYLLEKLNSMKRHPDQPYFFLDSEGMCILNCLKD